MNQGIKAFTKSHPKKAEELGMTNSTPNSNFVIPKLRKANAPTTSTKYANSDGEASGKQQKIGKNDHIQVPWGFKYRTFK